MDILSAPLGLLLGFGLAGIVLPIVGSFVLDGVVFMLRGVGPKTLAIAGLLFVFLLIVTAIAWQNGTTEAVAAQYTVASVDTMNGALGLILAFSTPLAALAFATRMLTRYASPAKRATESFVAQARRERIAARKARRHPVYTKA